MRADACARSPFAPGINVRLAVSRSVGRAVRLRDAPHTERARVPGARARRSCPLDSTRTKQHSPHGSPSSVAHVFACTLPSQLDICIDFGALCDRRVRRRASRSIHGLARPPSRARLAARGCRRRRHGARLSRERGRVLVKHHRIPHAPEQQEWHDDVRGVHGRHEERLRRRVGAKVLLTEHDCDDIRGRRASHARYG